MCKPYVCISNMAQMGHDLAHSQENSLDACSLKCCQNSQCIGFDWVSHNKDCYLSKTLQSKVRPVYVKGVYSCESRGMHHMYIPLKPRISYIRCQTSRAEMIYTIVKYS